MESFEKKLDLCLKKLDKSIDLDWDEIVEELKLNCSRDHLRKISYGYKEYDDYVKSKCIENSTNEEYEKLLKKENDIRKQLSKLSDLRTLINKENREQQRFENLIDMMKENIIRFDSFKSGFKNTYLTNDNAKEGIIILSDLHYGLEYNSEFNKYNSDIAEDRISYVVDKSIKECKSNKVNIIHLVINGDLLSGNIHLTSRLSNRENITQQVTGVSNLISKAIKRLSDEFEYVMVHLNSGNHDRICANKKDNGYEDTYINIIKDYVTIKTENLNNIIFNDNKYGHDVSVFNCCNKKIVCLHGDKIPYNQMIPRLTSMYGNIDYVLTGHIHHDKSNSFGNSKHVTCGSLSGMDRYAQELALNSRPTQKLIILEKNTNDELIYNIDLSHIR